MLHLCVSLLQRSASRRLGSDGHTVQDNRVSVRLLADSVRHKFAHEGQEALRAQLDTHFLQLLPGPWLVLHLLRGNCTNIYISTTKNLKTVM
jgi:hypothetical protein